MTGGAAPRQRVQVLHRIHSYSFFRPFCFLHSYSLAIHLRNVFSICISHASIGGDGVKIGPPPNLDAQLELDGLAGVANEKLTVATYMVYCAPRAIANDWVLKIGFSFLFSPRIHFGQTQYTFRRV